MNILLVDDDAQRHAMLREHYGPAHEYRERYTARSVTAKDIWWAGVVSLDHDMCEGGLLGRCPNPSKHGRCECPTGQDMARLIAHHEQPPRPIPLWAILHSANPVGARTMHRILNEAGVTVRLWPVTSWGREVAPEIVRILRGER